MPASVTSWTRAAYEDLDSADEPVTQQDEDEELLFEGEEDPTGWIESQSALGRPFFWHRCSRRSLWHLPPGASSRRRKGRKKRKKRKKKAPKSSSLRSSRGMRIHRCCQGLRSRSSLSGARPWSFPCSSFAWYVGICMAGLLVTMLFTQCSLCRRQARDAPHHGRYGPEGELYGLFCRYCTSRCDPSCRLQAQDACHHCRYGPEGPLNGELPFSFFDSGMCKAGIAVCVHFAMCSLCSRQAHDARHHGRYKPVRRTIEIPQYVNKVIDAPVMQFVRVPQVPSWRRQLCSHSCTC